MSEQNKSTLQLANAAISAGDQEGFLAFCSEDTRWVFVGDMTLSGKDAVREWMKTAYREPPRFDLKRMVAEADTVAAIGEITLKDDSGKLVRHAYCDVWRFREGLLAELQAFVVPL